MCYEIRTKEHKCKPVAVGKDEPEPAIVSGKDAAAVIEILELLLLIFVAGDRHGILLTHIAIVAGPIDATAMVNDLIAPQIFGVKAAHDHVDIRIHDDAIAASKEQKDAQRIRNGNRLKKRKFSAVAGTLSLFSLPLTLSSTYRQQQRAHVTANPAQIDDQHKETNTLHPGQDHIKCAKFIR